MIRLLLLFLLVSSNHFLRAQIRRGDITVTPSTTAPISKNLASTAISGNIAGFNHDGPGSTGVQSFLPQIGYALTSRFTLGLGFKMTYGVDDDSFAQDVVSPYFRLYAANGFAVQAYVGGRFNLHYSGDDVARFGQVVFEPNLGVTFPVSKGVRFAPEVTYMNNGVGNPLSLDLNFEFLMGRNRPNRATGGPYDAGRFMIGTQLGSLTLGRELDDAKELRLTPEVFIFPVDKLAVGVIAGIQYVYGENDDKRVSYLGGAVRYYPLQTGLGDLFTHGSITVERTPAQSGQVMDTQFIYDGGVGMVSYLAPNVGLEYGLGLRHNQASGRTEFTLNSGVKVLIGRY